MVNRRLGLTTKEVKKSKKALIYAILIILSVTLGLLVEYMIEDNLHEVSLRIQLAIAGFMFLLIVIVSIMGTKDEK